MSFSHKFLTNARRLVPFLPSRPISPGTTKEQDALLLTRLPAELRQMIWEKYFRGYAVHFYVEKEKLRAKECLELVAGDSSRGPHHDPCGQKNIPCDYLPLLLTCKEIYFECVHTLYQKTSFDFSHGVRSLTLLPKRLPATHVALISQVNLGWELPHPLRLEKKKLGKKETIWVEIWNVLAAMKGLKWLRVELRLAKPWEASEWTEIEGTLWEGVKKVTRPPHFELILPFPAASSTREETLPCTVIRRVVDVSHLGLG